MERKATRIILLAVVVAAAGGPGAFGGQLDPTAFNSLGAAALGAGSYTIDTTAAGGPTLSGDGMTFKGVLSGGVAVFDFDSLSVASGATIRATQGFGTLPIALLSRSSEVIAGFVSVSAFAHQMGSGAALLSDHGTGGNIGAYSTGPGSYLDATSGGGGGGGGAAGGSGGTVTFSDSSQVPGGSGEAAIENLATSLQGGGLGAPGGFGSISISGGGGGGAIELGAVLGLIISGEVDAIGGDAFTAGSGGGGGGGIYIHAAEVSLSGTLDVQGGAGGSGTNFPNYSYYAGGGGGGGGEVLIQAGSSGLDLSGGQVILSGGGGGPGFTARASDDGARGADGLLITTATPVPEPPSLLLSCVALASWATLAWKSECRIKIREGSPT